MINMIRFDKKWLNLTVILLIAAIAIFLIWRMLAPEDLSKNFASSNGRIEATEIDVAAKIPGRIAQIFVDEGDFVHPGEIVAIMDLKTLKARLNEVKAALHQAESNIAIAQSTVKQRESEWLAAKAVVEQRKAELIVAEKRMARSKTLSKEGAVSVQEYDNDLASVQGSAAALAAAKAQESAAESAIVTARSQIAGAQANADADRAKIIRVQADIDDSKLKAPRFGRVQYRIAQPGEVVGPGGRVLNLVDLSDVYMTFFLPTDQAGRVALGAEARIVLDAMPNVAIPARISYVADVAQFTPKAVETAKEREKLTFRIKARIDPKLLMEHIHEIKTGLPGMVYVKLNPKAKWPTNMKKRLLK